MNNDSLDKGKIDIPQTDSERISSQRKELPKVGCASVIVAIFFSLIVVPPMMALVRHAFILVIVLVLVEAFVLCLLANRLLNTLQTPFTRILGFILVTDVSACLVSFLGGGVISVVLWPSSRYFGLLLVFSVFVCAKWLLYRIYWRSSMLAMSIVVSVAMVAIFLLSVWLILPPGYRVISRMTHREANRNLPAIRDCEEAYKTKNGIYIECKASPARGGNDWRADEWDDSGGFTEIGFSPDDKVCFQYAVTVNEDGQSYVITATGDIRQDGMPTIYTMTRDDPSPVGRRAKKPER